jgi:hypothetical protein
MYGNTSFGGDTEVDLSPDQRRALRRDLTSLAARTREILPGEFVVGSEISAGQSGPEAHIAVQPPVGAPVSAQYTPEAGDVGIADDELEDIVHGLAASAALQVKQAMDDGTAPVAQ